MFKAELKRIRKFITLSQHEINVAAEKMSLETVAGDIRITHATVLQDHRPITRKKRCQTVDKQVNYIGGQVFNLILDVVNITTHSTRLKTKMKTPLSSIRES